jgi:uncharacterized repeat protein (TIGR01451 family)
MKRRALALFAGLLLLGLMPGPTLAGSAGVLDQSNPSTDTPTTICWGHSSGDLAQTFTADKSGTLTEVDLWMWWDGTGTATVTASIENTSSGTPVGPPLATATANVTSTPAWVQFFPAPPVTITSGTAYAIVFTPGSHVWICNAAGYSGAQAWAYDSPWKYYVGAGSSFAYQTYLAAAGAVLPPIISAAFAAPSMIAGQAVALKFTINNAAGNGPLTGVGVTDTLPSGLSVSNGSASACGGTLTRTAPSSIVLSGGSLADGASCLVAAMVTGSAAGSFTTTSGAVSSTEGGMGNTATASINVDAYPSLAAAFNPSSVAVGATTQLTITITNPAGNPDKLWPIDLASTLPAGLTVASATAVTTCGAGSLTVTAPGTIALFAASVAVGSPCVFSVPVTGTVAGTYTGTVTTRLGGWDYTGNTASASLGVAAAAPTATPTPSPTPAPTTVVQGATSAPTKAPTPPPTSTGVGPGSGNTGSTIWFLPFALLASIGGLLVLVDRRRRRIIQRF